MTRLEIEKKLEKRYLNTIVTFTTIHNKDITDKIHRIAVDFYRGTRELKVIFNLGNTRYECDAVYFFENTTQLNGNPNRSATGDPGV